MRNTSFLGIATIVLLTGFGIQPDQAFSETKPDEAKPSFAPDRILVKTKEDVPTESVEVINRKNNARTEKKIPRTRVNVVKLPKNLPVEEAVERYETSPNVEYAEPDYKVYPAQSYSTPNDADYPKLYGLNNTGQDGGTTDADVDAPEAWSATTGDASTVVAVIDTGVDVNHRDLKNNIWVNEDEVAGNGIDDDANGYVDDVNGWDFVNNDSSVFDAAADDRHGTHVAGTIAAEGNNDVGVTGVNWGARIMPLKFIGPNGSYISDAVEALDYAVANGAKISNNSWGGGNFSKTLLDAIRRADAAEHLFVAAAGNEVTDNDAAPFYPSSYDSPNITAVAATDNKDSLASFSNYGTTSVDLAAPGVSILSTVPSDAYAPGNGTSMATPHVTGVAALVKTKFPGLDDSEIKDRILSSVDRKAGLEGKMATGGRLNAAKAVGVNTAPTITNPRPASKTRDRTPNISATVRDDGTELTNTDMELYLDGQRITSFDYDQATDKLTYTSTRLSRTRHTVEVVAEDAQGISTTRSWRFIVR